MVVMDLASIVVDVCRWAWPNTSNYIHSGIAQVCRTSGYHDLWQWRTIRPSLYLQSHWRRTCAEV